MDYLKEAGVGGTTTISISVVVSILFVIGMWKMFAKAGEPGWASIIPFYNLYVLFKITWGKGAKFLLLLIPIFYAILGFSDAQYLGVPD